MIRVAVYETSDAKSRRSSAATRMMDQDELRGILGDDWEGFRFGGERVELDGSTLIELA